MLSFFTVYLALCGLVSFSLFILEESMQTAMFGIWPAQDAKDWQTVKAGADFIRTTNRTMTFINWAVGWIQPLSFVSYRTYSKAADIYVQGVHAKTFANAPELFAGERVSLLFTPEVARDGIATNRNIHVHSPSPLQAGKKYRVSGIVSLDDGAITIRADSISACLE